MIDADGCRGFERANLHLVVVTDVQQRDVLAFIQPLFQLGGGQFRAGADRWNNRFNPHRNDLFFQPHQHPAEWLVITQAFLDGKIVEVRIAGQMLEIGIDGFPSPRNKHVDAFGGNENGSF